MDAINAGNTVRCYNCQYEIPEGAKFCQNCGAPQSIRCQKCGTTLRATARFCSNCGTPVPRPATDDRPQTTDHRGDFAASSSASSPAARSELDRLQQYIPRELLGKLEAARTSKSMAGERRIVTVLFCDVKGSTAMAETLDPEEWAEIMNGAFKYLIEPVYTYEGTLARLMGDAILAFFGAPIAHEDDPQRAVLAGLGIVESIQPYRAEIMRKYGLDLNVRVGINTGLVVVGEVGSDLRVEYTAMGDAVNLASRMEQAAEPGTVLISGNTHKPVHNLFEFESLGELEVKGKAEPVPAYRVVKERAGAVPVRGIEGLSSPLVGRGAQLSALQAKVDDLRAGLPATPGTGLPATPGTGQGAIVSVIGEAGLGKSRLVAELKHTALGASDTGDNATETPPLQWHEGRSLSYETNTPYAPFVDLLNSCLGLNDEESDQAKMDRIKAVVGELMPGMEAQLAPFLATTLGLPLDKEDAQRVRYLDPPSLRERIYGAITALIGALSARGPLVLVFEDLHWVDPTSLELITRLLPMTESAPLMIMALFRPNKQDPSWGFHEMAARDYGHRYTEVNLSPLDEKDSRQLVANLLEIEDLPEKVRALILAKAEGNPFFVEEVIRSLLDSGLVVREGGHWRATRDIEKIAVPDTLQGVIVARLDRLDDDAKYAAQTASVVGREFGYDVLSEVYEAPTSLDVAVTTLQRRELVRERSRLPRRVYLFKHVLTQETAYASLLMSKRRELHLRVGECLERTGEPVANEIARHFVEARQEERALPYLIEAGERAARSGAKAEALSSFKKAVEVVQSVEQLGLARRAYEGLGKSYEYSMDMEGAFGTYHDMLHYAREHADIPMQVSALNKMSFLHGMVMGKFPEAEAHLAEAEKLASQYQDVDGLYELYTMRCGICMMAADFSSADRYLTEAVDLGRRTNRLDNLAYGLAHKANTLAMLARFDEAWDVAQEAVRVSDEAGNLEHKSTIMGEGIPIYFVSKGDFESARKYAEEAYEIAERIGAMIIMVIPAFVLSTIHESRGEYEFAIEWCERGQNVGRMLAGIFPFMLAMVLGVEGLVCVGIGAEMARKGVQLHSEVYELLQHPAGAPAGGSAWADLGFCALAQGKVDDAASHFERGLTAPSIQMHVQRARLLCGAALAAILQGRLEDADRQAGEARQYAQEHAMADMMPLVEFTAGRVIEAKGDCETALGHYSEAERLALEIGMRPMVLDARLAAAKTLTVLGRLDEGEQKKAQAKEMREEIASLFKNEEYRRMYLEKGMRNEV